MSLNDIQLYRARRHYRNFRRIAQSVFIHCNGHILAFKTCIVLNDNLFLDSERSDECIDFRMIITSRNNVSISNFGGGFRWKSKYPWCIIEFKFLRNLSKTRKIAITISVFYSAAYQVCDYRINILLISTLYKLSIKQSFAKSLRQVNEYSPRIFIPVESSANHSLEKNILSNSFDAVRKKRYLNEMSGVDLYIYICYTYGVLGDSFYYWDWWIGNGVLIIKIRSGFHKNVIWLTRYTVKKTFKKSMFKVGYDVSDKLQIQIVCIGVICNRCYELATWDKHNIRRFG
ncbi:hypothetical protein AGLY_002411 [Aphis glycines]|uniref:Uncharacterized protein n=1 Tax=Aphis glycines TaxID=307491 RepID=A0A6G0U3B1_APHGL|nr:hypothetical protein AGLY_002411 [Aphis glycines]